MNIYKIKYRIAVAAALAATAFCGCGSSGEEVIYTDKSIAMAEDRGTILVAEEAEATLEEAVPEEAKEIRVYVCGAVKSPGVYTLLPDRRLVDAVDAAGGFTEEAGTDYLNLAAALSDGQKIYVPTRQEVESAIENGAVAAAVNITSNTPGITSAENMTGPGNELSSPSEDSDGKVDINFADVATLMTPPGIGRQKAEKIIAYREENGPFSRIEDIMLVGGIKEGLFHKVKDSICVR